MTRTGFFLVMVTACPRPAPDARSAPAQPSGSSANVPHQPLAPPGTRVSTVPFEGEHPVYAVTLADGRTFTASAGHPLADGSLVGGLRVGTHIDGTVVRSIHTRSIRDRTWDILPEGGTGTYWADGVHLGSTLRTR